MCEHAYGFGKSRVQPAFTPTLAGMGEKALRRERARRTAITVMSTIRENIDDDPTVNRSQVAEQAGMAVSTFYRWLANPPKKIDTIQLSAVADYLHDTYGHEDFATLWRRIQKTVQ